MRRLRPLLLCATLAMAPLSVAADVTAGLDAFQKGDAAGAARAFQTAFDAGDADGAFYLGRMFETGQGAAQDTAQAIALYKTAVEGGSALAMNRMGLLHLEGTGVIRDFAQGADLLCRAADLGLADAQFNCGVLLTEGRGVEKDVRRARGYWQEAADQDHIGAINLLAQASKAGDQTAADPVAAFELFSRTAALGNAMGLFEVAQAHLAGSGTEVDLVQAYAYANIAAARGHPEGAALRDKVEALLTPEEIAIGQSAARDWIAADDARAKAASLEN